jgi:hypothetical protein
VSDSPTLRWQRWLLALCVIGFMILAFQVFQNNNAWRGRAGISHTVTTVAFHDTVTAVVPDWPAAEAGIRRGDLVDLRAASAPDRWRFRNSFIADHAYRYALLRGTTEQHVTFRPKRYSGWRPDQWFWFAGALGSLTFATIIAWCRPWLTEARVLCLLLIASVVETCLQPANWITPWAELDFGAALLSHIFLESVVVLVYTTLFGWPLSPLRKIVTAVAWLSFAFDILLNLASSVGTWSAVFDLVGGSIGRGSFIKIWFPLSYVFLLLPIALAFAASRGRERSLFVWTMALPFLVYLDSGIGFIPAVASNPTVYSALIFVDNGAVFLTPFAIGYALLSRSRFSPMTAAAGTMA